MITKKYEITGMTCSGCEAKVKSILTAVENVVSAEVSKDDNSAVITSTKELNLENLRLSLPDKYNIRETSAPDEIDSGHGWSAYKPVLLIFLYITVVTGLIQTIGGKFDWMEWMRHFMAGFFLVFSFFKMLNLKGFAQSYTIYDLIAKRLPGWAYVYAYTELALGIAFLINFNPLLTNSITFIVMSVSIIGVLQSVLNKKKIQCACLGAVFNLPMSTITIIEDGMMILMSGWMILESV
jgi:copper chaperone CopZ